MSEKSQLLLMAEYNQLMNQRIFSAAKKLSAESLREDKGAFFKSVLASLNHIMIGDILWLKRFSGHLKSFKSLKSLEGVAKPERLDQILFDDVDLFEKNREELDKVIIKFCEELSDSDLDESLSYVNFLGIRHHKKLGSLILHVFLHQVHHRGQVTTLLSQQGIDFGETDLPEIVPEMQV